MIGLISLIPPDCKADNNDEIEVVEELDELALEAKYKSNPLRIHPIHGPIPFAAFK